MRIVSVTMVRNEADVVEAFARHHLGFVDHMVFIDHRSIDATPDILRGLAEEGAPIEVVPESRLYLPQAELTTAHMHRAARKLGADWVLLLDTDEFVASDDGACPGTRIEDFAPDRVHKLPWRCYVPRPGDDPGQPDVLARIQHRRAREPIQFGKILVPRELAADPATYLEVGNHGIRRGGPRGKKIKSVLSDVLHLAHFPVRSIEQFTAKVLLGWPARLASPEQTKTTNYHFRGLFERLVEGQALTPEHLERIALGYAVPADAEAASEETVLDPVRSPAGPLELRHSNGRFQVDLARAIAELAADVGHQLAAERSRPWWKRWRRLGGGGRAATERARR